MLDPAGHGERRADRGDLGLRAPDEDRTECLRDRCARISYGWGVGVQPSGTIEALWYTPDEVGTSTLRITGPERPNNVKAYATCTMEVT